MTEFISEVYDKGSLELTVLESTGKTSLELYPREENKSYFAGKWHPVKLSKIVYSAKDNRVVFKWDTIR